MNLYERERLGVIQKQVQELQSAVHRYINSVPAPGGDAELRAAVFKEIGHVLAAIVLLQRGTPER